MDSTTKRSSSKVISLARYRTPAMLIQLVADVRQNEVLTVVLQAFLHKQVYLAEVLCSHVDIDLLRIGHFLLLSIHMDDSWIVQGVLQPG